MPSTIVYRDVDGFEVWIGPDVARTENIKDAFIVGVGLTLGAALAEAVKELEAITEMLQSPPGNLRVVDVRPLEAQHG